MKIHFLACDAFAYRVKASPKLTRCGLVAQTTLKEDEVTCKKCLRGIQIDGDWFKSYTQKYGN